jgi:hypothetical protein
VGEHLPGERAHRHPGDYRHPRIHSG